VALLEPAPAAETSLRTTPRWFAWRPLTAAAAGLVIGLFSASMVFGFGVRMELSVVAFATFWPMLILTQAAARQVEPRLLEVSAALGLTAWQRTTWIVLPAMVPRLFVALRLGVAVALVVAVTVEIAANPNGMGYAMMIAQQSMEPARMLAWLFWIGVVGSLINALTLRAQHWVHGRMGGVATDRGTA
jgi:ABC-type nitrate/sulfonate/bicarbonate transport system permease component